MRIDAHVHAYRGKTGRDESGKLSPPLTFAWNTEEMTPEEYVETGMKEYGIEKIMLLDPPGVTFKLKEIFKDYVLPVPMVDIDNSTPEQINGLFNKGAVGIKFIAPTKSYGDDSYFPLYDAIATNRGLAVFHTGYVLAGRFEPGCWDERKSVIDITDMRPSALDRVARAFPDLKILMAHFGNPWWEEAWKIMSSHRNIYADLSGGTAYGRPMSMWKEIFAPNGILDTTSVSKLCFATDSQSFVPGRYGNLAVYKFYDRLFEVLKMPAEIQDKVNRGNILGLIQR